MPGSVVLDSVQEASVERLIAAGRYGSPEEAIAGGVALLLRHQDRLAARHQAWREGVDSGDHQPHDATLDTLEARDGAREQDVP
jgi:antitoxin ParD1/3/4